VLIGEANVGENLDVQLATTSGDMPSLRDDLFIRSFGKPGDEMIINATNNDAAAQEARVIIRVTEIDDVVLLQALGVATAGVT